MTNFVIFSFTAITLFAALDLSSNAARVSCKMFKTQAQAAYDRDPIKYAPLDRDQDGIACEHFP